MSSSKYIKVLINPPFIWKEKCNLRNQLLIKEEGGGGKSSFIPTKMGGGGQKTLKPCCRWVQNALRF